MEFQLVHPGAGAELAAPELNLATESAGLADDRVLAELFRQAPYVSGTKLKAILPSMYAGGSSGAVVQRSTGGVLVGPFRAFVQTRVTQATDAVQNWRDIRSAVYAPPSGTLTTFAANASGNPRWDLVYCKLDIDVAQGAVTRKKKDPSTGAVTSQSVSYGVKTQTSLGVVQGTPGASPAQPAITADSGSSYYIPLAYVRIANGFTGATLIAHNDVEEVSPVITMGEATGAASVQVANQQNKVGGTVLTSTPWPASGNRTPEYMPPTMVGSAERLIAIFFGTSHVNNSIVDDSIDWRYRIFQWTVFADSLANDKFAWDPALVVAGNAATPNYLTGMATRVLTGFGQSMTDDSANSGMPAGSGAVVLLTPALITGVNGTGCGLYVDMSNGKLVAYRDGAVTSRVFWWLRASGMFNNSAPT